MKRALVGLGLSMVFALSSCDSGGRMLTRSGSVPCPPGSGMVETWCADDGYCEFRVTSGGTYSCDVHDGTSCQEATMQAVSACQMGGAADGGGVGGDAPVVTNPCQSLCAGCPSSDSCFECEELDREFPPACNALLAAWGSCVRSDACAPADCEPERAAYLGCTCGSVATALQQEARLCGSALTFDCADPFTATNIAACSSWFDSIGCAAFEQPECGGDPCMGTTTYCSGSCVDTSTDPRNCGACGRACTSGMACTGGTCSSAPTCTLTGTGYTPPLPAACMPRCSAATESEALACTVLSCVLAAMARDTTPAINANAGGTIIPINCETCGRWQQQSCLEDSCPTEYAALVACGTGSCAAQNTALNNCASANETAYVSCISTRILECF